MSEEKIIQSKGIYDTFPRKGGDALRATHYCAGCGHGVLHKLIAEAMVDLGIRDRTVALSPVGCAVFAYYYFDCGNVQAAHGRAPAVATGISRAEQQSVVISYQGDGDLASIGLNETMQAANRGERLAVFFVNNTVYGMTGGQMAPTTLVGERTITCPSGRDPRTHGYPMHMSELINTLDAPVFIERVSLGDIRKIRKARSVVRKALEIQRDRKGYTFVEVLCTCPTALRTDAAGNAAYLEDKMEKEYPLGNLRDRSDEAEPFAYIPRSFERDDIDTVYGISREGDEDEGDFSDEPRQCYKFAGFGGQGVLSMGVVLARAAQLSGHYTSWYPSYGPEQRGGTCNCAVAVGGSASGSPVVDQPDVLVAFNQPSLERFVTMVKPGGTVLYDTMIPNAPDEIDGVKMVAVPATEEAKRAGSELCANIFMLGALVGAGCSAFSAESFERAISQHFDNKRKILDLNLDVFRRGVAFGAE